MFERLQKKWKVSGWQLLIILIIFALGGSITGYLGRRVMNFFDIDSTAVYIILYVLIVTIIWPFAVLAVSIPFGQFLFFRKYILRLGNRLFTWKKN